MKVMRTTVATVVAATLSMSAFSVFAEASLTGAGATFPAPVYAKWADTCLLYTSYVDRDHAPLMQEINQTGGYNDEIEGKLKGILDSFKATQSW